MTANKKHFIVFGRGVSETVIAGLPIELPDAEVLPVSSGRFPAGAEFVEIHPFDKVSYQDNAAALKNSVVTIVQSTGEPCAENMMFACEAIDNARRAGARVVNVVLPYMEYMRQDRPDQDRFTSVANTLMPKFLAVSGADHVTLITPHSQEGIEHYQGVFGKNFQFVKASELFIEHLRASFGADLDSLVVGAPDGANKPGDQGHSRAIEIAKALFGDDYEAHLFGIHKERTGPGKSEIAAFNGDVSGKTAIVIDDMIDGGGTMLKAAARLREEGAKDIHIAAVHGLFSQGLAPLLAERDNQDHFLINSIITSDTLPVERVIRDGRFQFPNIDYRVTIIETSPVIARAVEQVLENATQIARDAKSIPRVDGRQVGI